MQRAHGCIDTGMGQKPRRMARVFGSNNCHVRQNVARTRAEITEIADRRGHDPETGCVSHDAYYAVIAASADTMDSANTSKLTSISSRASSTQGVRMNSHTFHNIGLLLLLIVCIGLAACSGPGLRGGAGDRAMPSSAGQGDQYARAAARYAAQARQQSSSQKRDQLRMKAATAALRAKQPDQARQLLDPIDAEQLDAADRQQYQLLQTLLRAAS